MNNPFSRFAITVSRLIPKSGRDSFSQLIKYSGKKSSGEAILGNCLLIGILILLICVLFGNLYPYEESYLSITEAKELNPDFDEDFESQTIDGQHVSTIPVGFTQSQFTLSMFALGLVLMGFPFFVLYIIFFFLVERRTKFVEKILPDALSLIASNMTSGLTAYHAVKSAIRDDFGPLSEAFEVATNKSISKKSFKESLLEIPDNIKSSSLERSVKLFATAMESGSNVSSLLKNLSQDISERQALKTDLVTSTMTNSMFIMFMVVVGGPMLMAVSIFFVEIVSGIMSKAGSNTGDVGGLGMGAEIVITPQFLTFYAYVFFLITGVLVASFTGTMIEGDSKSGLKKAPIIIILSYIVFFFAQYLIRSSLGGMFS